MVTTTSKEMQITEPDARFQREVIDQLGGLCMGSIKDQTSADSTSSSTLHGDVTSSNEGNVSDTSRLNSMTNQELVGERGACSKPTNSYDNHRQEYNGRVTKLGTHDYTQESTSLMGAQADNHPMEYATQSYNTHLSSRIVGAEAMPCYLWNSTCVGDVTKGKSSFEHRKHGSNSIIKVKSSTLNSTEKNDGNISNKSTCTQSQPFFGPNKVNPSGFNLSSSLLDGHGQFNSSAGQNQVLFPHSGSSNHRQKTRVWNGNGRNKSRNEYHKSVDFETSPELPYGPRAQNHTDSSTKMEDLGVMVRREHFNLPDFPIVYENAKFFIIKSYSEDDVHKSVKYGVWSSTPHGNKKLDACFREAEEKSSENGTKCPIFLFFSVNGSGQFVGVAEMAGQVDFNKDMDFWQVDKWLGFFPVKWHILKDVPNQLLRHIILENNDNKAVTHTRDTQEVLLKQGLEMLRIFKSYPAKQSLLDDFSFYENREKSRTTKPATLRREIKEDDFHRSEYLGETKFTNGFAVKKALKPSSPVNLTKNLSIYSRATKDTNNFARKWA